MTNSPFLKLFDALASKNLSLSKGDEVFKQGDCVNNIYFIKTGKIKLIRNTSDGSPVILHIGLKGEPIAEASLFSDNYHCTAVADSVSSIWYVNKQSYLKFLQENPQVAIELVAILSRQVRDLRALNEIKNIRSASERILTYIKMNADKNQTLLLELSLKDMAHKIGLAHETFYRALKTLENSGEIKRYTGRIELKK